jgi:ribosome-associated protein
MDTSLLYRNCAQATAMDHDCDMRDVPIRDEAIRLGQFLKLSDAVEVGSDVKLLLGANRVHVNGELETRRGRQLVKGDIVAVDEKKLRVS